MISYTRSSSNRKLYSSLLLLIDNLYIIKTKCITQTISLWALVAVTVDIVGTYGKINIEGGKIIVDIITMVD